MPFKRSLWLAAALSCVFAAPAVAQLNPQRNIILVVPIAAGGGVDAIGRLLAEKLQERLKQNVVVENRTGAGGTVGTDSVAKAAPDGHTLLVMESSSAISKWLNKGVPFDVVTDFAPIARAVTTPLMLFAHPSVAANDPKGIIEQAKAEQALGRHSRSWHAASLGDADDERRRQDRHHPCAVSRHRPRAERSARRPDSTDVGDADCGDAACRHRQGEDARHRVAQDLDILSDRCRRSPRRHCPASR